MVHFGCRSPVGGPLRVSGWLPEAEVCFGGPPGSMCLTQSRPVAPTGVLSPVAVAGGSQPQQNKRSWGLPPLTCGCLHDLGVLTPILLILFLAPLPRGVPGEGPD